MCILIGALNVWHVCVHAALEPDCYMRGRGAAEDGCDLADAGAFSYDLVFSLLVALVGLLPTAAARRRVHAYLLALRRQGEARQAALVAHLVGRRGARRALQSGVESFCGLPFSALTAEDFISATDSGLYSRTRSARLGEVDVFVSHSWHDSGEAKWAMLCRWAEHFEERHGREPLIWLDKGCINQQAIDESLSSLPVYLAGCRELLVLAGETYTRRLWCVMEMLVFLRMGGSADRVTVLPVPTRSDARSSNAFETMLRRTASLFEAFDAREASCFHPEDRQRLLGVMEAGFGSLPVFNTVVRRIFAGAVDRLDRDQSSRDLLWDAALSVRGSFATDSGGQSSRLGPSPRSSHAWPRSQRSAPAPSRRSAAVLGQSRRSVAETYSDRTITHTEEGEAEGGGGGEGAMYPAVLRLASLMRQLTGTSEADGGGGRGRSVPPAVALVRSGTAPEMEMC
uniref:TIR domain-containing protein n=2 Tax=Emiliania huxleyi TaxID=2903 RepID=A0A7S3WFN8_EMIHU